MIILSVSSGLGTAANVLVSNALGEEDEDKAHIYIGQSIGLLVILGVA